MLRSLAITIVLPMGVGLGTAQDAPASGGVERLQE
jgi:hypothetical protein